MTQFMVKTVGVILAGALVIYIINTSFPGLFDLKKLLPTSVYSFIQEFTPYLAREKNTHIITL